MARVKGGTVARNRRKKTLKEAKGYFGSKHRLYKTAKEQLLHSGVYAYRDRKRKKRDFRKLWITRINAACRENEISYSKFINGLNIAKLSVNRKMLSEIAITNPETFKELVEISKSAIDGKKYEPKVEVKKAEPKVEVKKTIKAEPKEEVKIDVKTETKKTIKAEPKVAVKKAVKSEPKAVAKESKPTVKKAPTKKVTAK